MVDDDDADRCRRDVVGSKTFMTYACFLFNRHVVIDSLRGGGGRNQA